MTLPNPRLEFFLAIGYREDIRHAVCFFIPIRRLARTQVDLDDEFEKDGGS